MASHPLLRPSWTPWALLALLVCLVGWGPRPARAALAPSLDYVEIVTGGADPDDPLPLVVALHGRGGGIAQLRNELSRMQTPVRLIVPRGPVPVEGGRRAWFDEKVRHRGSVELASAVDSTTSELVALIENVRRRRPTCGKAMVVGWSQGGVLAFSLALRHPTLVEHAVVVGGSVPDSLIPRRLAAHAPITALHGTSDRRVPYRRTRSVVHGLQSLGYAVELHAHPKVGHELTGAMRRELRGLVRDDATMLAGRCWE